MRQSKDFNLIFASLLIYFVFICLFFRLMVCCMLIGGMLVCTALREHLNVRIPQSDAENTGSISA